MENFAVYHKIRFSFNVYISDWSLDVDNIWNSRVIELKEIECAVHRRVRARTVWDYPDRDVWQRARLADPVSLRTHDACVAYAMAQRSLIYEHIKAGRLRACETPLPVEPRFNSLTKRVVIDTGKQAPDKCAGILFRLQQRRHVTCVESGDLDRLVFKPYIRVVFTISKIIIFLPPASLLRLPRERHQALLLSGITDTVDATQVANVTQARSALPRLLTADLAW